MATIIPSEMVDQGIRKAVFGGAPGEPAAGRPMIAPKVDRFGGALPAPEGRAPLPAPEPAAVASPPPEPAPAPAPAPAAAPAEQPIFEVPGEILQGVYDQAVTQGLEDGKAQVFAELTVLQERYAAAMDQLVGVTKELQAQNQIQLMSLACHIAQQLVRSHLQANPQDLMALVAEVLQSVEGQDEVLVTCSPQDQQYMLERRADLEAGAGGAFTVRVVADPKLEYGDFQIETRLGTTDGRVSSRMAQAERALMGGGD